MRSVRPGTPNMLAGGLASSKSAVPLAEAQLRQGVRETLHPVVQFAAIQANTASIGVTCGQCWRVGAHRRQAQQVVRII